MNITSLTLHNFRNFWQSPEIDLPRGALLVAAAPNATGKTNFLESLVVLLRGKSWRGATEDCVRWGQESFTVRGEVEHGGIKSQLAVRYHRPTKKLRIEEDGSPASPITFFSHYPFILFLPEDSFLFAGGPALRRNFLNQTLVCSPAYVSALVQYQRALRQRNAAL
ncbi:hypothetical protein IH781_02690, partial [Patescibacteria group bacterium]|nr:hypothetical protein [Patescibacteria group bacterium]